MELTLRHQFGAENVIVKPMSGIVKFTLHDADEIPSFEDIEREIRTANYELTKITIAEVGKAPRIREF